MKAIQKENHRGATVPWSVGGVLLISSLAAIGYRVLRPGPVPPEISSRPPTVSQVQRPDSEFRKELFSGEVVPAIEEADRSNREAAERCLRRIRDAFERYQLGVKPFVDDVNTLATKLAVLRRMPGDWWSGQDSVQRFLATKLQKHGFSAETIQRDIEISLALFREDVEANQVVMLRKVKLATAHLPVPALQDIDAAAFSEQVIEQVRQFSAETATNGVVDLVVTEAAAGVGGYAVQKLFTAIIVRLGTTAGGATVGSALTGGGGGTIAGPLGAGAGFAGGLVAGLMIDAWLSEQAKAMLCTQLSGLIDQIEDAVIHGIEEGDGANSKAHPGLESILEDTCDAWQRAYREILQQSVVGDAT